MPAVFDLVIRGGRMVTDGGETTTDLAVSRGRVAAWLAPDTQVDAKEIIDASGLVVLPGVLDAHVHMREPGLVHKEGFASGSRAAAAGGVTTILVMPTDVPATFTPQQFEDKRKLADGQCHVDFGLQAACVDSKHIADLARLGAVSFEIFLGDIAPELLMGDNDHLLRVMAAIASEGVIAGVSPADAGIVAGALQREDGNADALAFSRSRPPASEAMGVARAGAAARLSGARVHLRQVSCRSSGEILAAMRGNCPGLTGEVMVHNLVLTERDTEHQGPFAKVLPPLRTQRDIDALWSFLRAGTLDIVASDHAPHLPEEKEAGRKDVWQGPGGFPGVQTLLPIMLDSVSAGRISWIELARLCAERPAQLFGLYPRKGSLQPGADADIVLVDPGARHRIENSEQHSKAGVTPFAGREVTGWPVRTLLRGRTIMCDGVVSPQATGSMVAPGNVA